MKKVSPCAPPPPLQFFGNRALIKERNQKAKIKLCYWCVRERTSKHVVVQTKKGVEISISCTRYL